MCFFMLFLIMGYAQNIYYVDVNNGNDDNSGLSEEMAFKTIQKASFSVAPGDEVNVLPGIYKNEDPNNPYGEVGFYDSGAPGQYITFRGINDANGNRPKIEVTAGKGFDFFKVSYIIIDNFEFYASEDDPKGIIDNPDFGIESWYQRRGVGIDNESHHIIIRNNYFHDLPGNGVAVSVELVIIENNIIEHCAYAAINANSGISFYQPKNTGQPGFPEYPNHRIIIKNNISRYNTNLRGFAGSIGGNRVTDGNGIIIDDFRQDQKDASVRQLYEGRTLVIDNQCYGNGGQGINVFSSDFVDVVDNIMFDNAQSTRIADPAYPVAIGDSQLSLGRVNDVVVKGNVMVNSNSDTDVISKYEDTNVTYIDNIHWNTGGNAVIVGGNDLVLNPNFSNATGLTQTQTNLLSTMSNPYDPNSASAQVRTPTVNNGFPVHNLNTSYALPAQSTFGNGGNPWAISPGTVLELENYDQGGQNVAYNDVADDAENGVRDACGRIDEVDVASGSGGNCVITFTEPGEWLEYTVNVAAGSYDINLLAATSLANQEIRILLDGIPLGDLPITNTGDFGVYQPNSLLGVALPEGEAVLRLEVKGYYNLDNISFTPGTVIANDGIVVRAKGTTGEETFDVEVNGVKIGETQVATTEYENYVFETAERGTVRVVFTNNGETATGADITLIVDRISIDGIVFEAENQAVNTGAYDETTNSCGGISSERLDCNGFIEFEGTDSGGDDGEPNVTEAADIFLTEAAPLLDGIKDAAYGAQGYDLNSANMDTGTLNIDSSDDLSGTYYATWDDTNLYFFVRVTDDVLVSDSPEPYEDDGVEIYIDGDNAKGDSYDSNDFQFTFKYNDGTLYEIGNGYDVSNAAFEMIETADGYDLEVVFSLASLGIVPNAETSIGLDVHLNDDDGSGRESKLAWFATADSSWNDPSLFGEANLILGSPANEIIVTARGTTGEELFEVQVNGEKIGESRTATTSNADYSFFAPSTEGTIRVVFTNNGETDNGGDITLIVDKIMVNGQTLEAEDQAINTGAYDAATNTCGGISSERLDCNGYIEFVNGGSTTGLVFGEVGKSSNNHTFKTVTLNNTYNDPIVFVGSISFNGGNAAVVRVKDVASNSFQWQVDEWEYLDEEHASEDVGYMVVERGEHIMSNGAEVKAGSFLASTSWKTVQFSSAFTEKPNVFANVASLNGGDAVGVRIRNVSTTGFQVLIQEEENGGTQDGNRGHNDENIHYIAITSGTGSGDGSAKFEVSATPNSVTDAWYTINFEQSYSSQNALFMAYDQTTDGGDTGTVRYRSFNGNSAQVRFHEETSRDSEVAHATEIVGYAVFDAIGDLTTGSANAVARLDDALSAEVNIRLAPNPVLDGTITVSSDLNNYSVRIFDMLGRTVFTKTELSGEEQLNIGRLKHGTYVLNVIGDQGSTSVKMIVN